MRFAIPLAASQRWACFSIQYWRSFHKINFNMIRSRWRQRGGSVGDSTPAACNEWHSLNVFDYSNKIQLWQSTVPFSLKVDLVIDRALEKMWDCNFSCELWSSELYLCLMDGCSLSKKALPCIIVSAIWILCEFRLEYVYAHTNFATRIVISLLNVPVNTTTTAHLLWWLNIISGVIPKRSLQNFSAFSPKKT